MRGDGANHHEKLGLKRLSCESQFTIPDTAGTSPDLACNTSAKCKSVRKQHAILPDTPGDLTSASKYF